MVESTVDVVDAGQAGLALTVQSKQEPTSLNDDVVNVGYVAPDAREGGADVLGRKAGYVVPANERKPIVTNWSGTKDFANCPPDYETFYRQYMDYTFAMVRRYGARPDEVEDIAMSIMTRFMERDSLGVFTPSWGSQSESGVSYFRNYYTQFIFTYFTGLRRNNARYGVRNLKIYDAPVGRDDGDSATFGEIKAPPSFDDSEDAVRFEELIEDMRGRVKDAELFDVVVSLLTGTDTTTPHPGEIKQADIKRALSGCNAIRAREGLADIRAALTGVREVQGF